jgi:hypothetical protein
MVRDVYSVNPKSCYRSEISIVEMTKGRSRENRGGSQRDISYKQPRKLVLKERTYEVVGERACFDASGRDFWYKRASPKRARVPKIGILHQTQTHCRYTRGFVMSVER